MLTSLLFCIPLTYTYCTICFVKIQQFSFHKFQFSTFCTMSFVHFIHHLSVFFYFPLLFLPFFSFYIAFIDYLHNSSIQNDNSIFCIFFYTNIHDCLQVILKQKGRYLNHVSSHLPCCFICNNLVSFQFVPSQKLLQS